MRFNELRETLQLRLSGEFKRFADEERGAVLTLLAGPGVILRWILPTPAGRKRIAQRFIAGARGEQVPLGTKEHLGFCRTISFAPDGAFEPHGHGFPPLKRWAIFKPSLTGLETQRS